MGTVLIAEDEDILRRNLTFIFNNFGYTAYAARNTFEAIKILDKRHVDVLITDLVMPEKGGGELIQYTSTNYPETFIIIITAYPSLDSAIEAVRRGIVDYFTKPFKTEEIIASVKRAMMMRKATPYTWEKLHAFGITAREKQILMIMIEDGLGETKEIAEKLSVKTTTIKQHLENLYGKFGVKNRTALLSKVVSEIRK